jgi:hypothetical protein
VKRVILFQPQLSRAQASRLARKYADEREEGALAAGKAIRGGQPSRAHLEIIYEWKTGGRGRSRLSDNCDKDVVEALRFAAKAEQPRSAIAVLSGLYGVNIPVASAIATVIHPDRYTIVDFRALHALGIEDAVSSLPFYLEYLRYCIGLSEKWKIPLRSLDRALWQWSKDQGLG